MSAAIRCELCGVIFAPFSTDPDVVVLTFNTHPCIDRRRNHPSKWRSSLTGGAA